MTEFAVLTPYIVPPSMPTKKVNLGDGIILRAIERRTGSFAQSRMFTSREAPSPVAIQQLRNAKAVVLAGANQLSDDFSVWPGATAAEISSSNLTFVPFGIGLHGAPERNRGFSENTRDIIEAIHQRVEFSSWRCPRTIALLDAAFPRLRGRFLMTGCPALFDEPLLNGSRFLERQDSIAVTVTDRGDFWDRESHLLRFVAEQFSRARKTLVLHQDFAAATAFEQRFQSSRLMQPFLSKRMRLRNLAARLGYRIEMPRSADELIRLYDGMNFHIGSRLHAHLLFLSRNKCSFLIAVDDRPLGFAEYLKFPLVDYRNIGRHLNFDFEIVRENARATFATMQKFVASIMDR